MIQAAGSPAALFDSSASIAGSCSTHALHGLSHDTRWPESSADHLPFDSRRHRVAVTADGAAPSPFAFRDSVKEVPAAAAALLDQLKPVRRHPGRKLNITTLPP